MAVLGLRMNVIASLLLSLFRFNDIRRSVMRRDESDSRRKRARVLLARVVSCLDLASTFSSLVGQFLITAGGHEIGFQIVWLIVISGTSTAM